MTSPQTLVEEDDPPEIETVEQAVELLLRLKADMANLVAEVLFVENWIDNAVKETTIVTVGDKQYRTTPVRSMTTSVDVEKFEELMPALAKTVVTQETVEKVNTDLLTREIKKGNVPVSLMTQFISQKPKKTSIKVTEYVAREEDEEDDD